MSHTVIHKQIQCYHCGEDCNATPITFDEKSFCCEGCKMVYQILNQKGLCDYYSLNSNPGSSQKIKVRKDKFRFLQDPEIQLKLISYRDDSRTHITFYLPHIHCSSCLWLLENLHRLNEGIISSKVNFPAKEVSLVFDQSRVSLQETAELLTSIGYEPYISLNDLNKKNPRVPKSMLIRLGIAGFCFGNIMLLSFPEYLGLDHQDQILQPFFRLLNFLLSLPVFLYSAQPFYSSAWKGLKHRFLNIDAPIVLAILVTFGRSVYEVATGTGSGYFDSMSGIIFFMLAGRVLQDKTYEQLSFDRDFTSYFPVAITVLKDDKEIPTALPDLKAGDTMLIHNEELIPADGILTRGRAYIDYSFVTGESLPVTKETGEIVYAGGKQKGGPIEVYLVKEVSQSYLTSLWNKNNPDHDNAEEEKSFVQLLSRYFTWIVFAIATAAAIWWALNDPSRIWPSVTAVLIIACPCALLLSNTFTNGNVLRILSRNHFYLRNAQTIEEIAGINHIVFDKTGTLTSAEEQEVSYHGTVLSFGQLQMISALASCSTHPLSKSIAGHLGLKANLPVSGFREFLGKGTEGYIDGTRIRLGSKYFVDGTRTGKEDPTRVYIGFGDLHPGYFSFSNHYREEIPKLTASLKDRCKLSVISGDNASERTRLQQLLGKGSTLRFQQKPEDKLCYVRQLQADGEKVMMVGDGLNDSVALKQSNVGIALAENSNTFTPASDAILESSSLSKLPEFIRLCRSNRQVVMASFIMSIVYNLVGLYFAVQGILSPLIAAILMPASSISIVVLTYGITNLIGRRLKL